MNKIRDINEPPKAGERGITDLTDGEVKTIAAFVITNEKRKTNARYLEIGVLAGATIRFCKKYTQSTQFVGVDLFEDFISANNNTHISGTFRRDDVLNYLGDRVTLVKGDSHQVLPTLEGTFDHIFIDGNHTYEATLKDFNNAQKLLAPGGQISFHNASPHLGPDFELYITVDGGPWLVTQEIVASKEWDMVAEVDRLRVFTKAT
jgi:spermidine synthase